MSFCPTHSSMLVPKEDRKNKTLRYACKLCDYSEVAQSNLVYRNQLKQQAEDILGSVSSALSDDPTLSRSDEVNCEECGHKTAVFFQSTATGMNCLPLVFICCNCGHKWVSKTD
ncbi:hypothetical protein TrLO_g15756 [Triparma laevis f. longispina]|uniref:TFIIS-type domain-containing protein n=2 Tax=Triparma laevis TaxID=1534972 RepID=A0A9W7EIS4_9STRA|nr:hypothetical protein TrLO_g15756 [Triparma laevis f. longispina]